MVPEDTLLKFNTIFARTVHVDETSIPDALVLESIPSWDSFTALMLISELESGFDVHFTMDEITTIKKVGDIKKILRI